ncbi:hypothetical protein [Streptomyces sp. NPDC059701]|uniref:hypothetical protein n=1 Tax=Streptomyces sp. NPDC059701 TaxID=3346914 RepID=UPI0036929972
MTPEQLDTAINAYVAVDAAVTEYGPGLAVAAGLWATARVSRRIAHRLHQRRGLRRIEHYANHPLAHRLHTADRKETES